VTPETASKASERAREEGVPRPEEAKQLATPERMPPESAAELGLDEKPFAAEERTRAQTW